MLYPKDNATEDDMPKKLLDLEMLLNGEIATLIYQRMGFAPRFCLVETEDENKFMIYLTSIKPYDMMHLQFNNATH